MKMTVVLNIAAFLFGVQSNAMQFANSNSFKKVMTVVLENSQYSAATAQPFLQKLAREGVLMTRFHALAHPSEPNYISMISGSTYGLFSDKEVTIDAMHIGDLLEAKGKRWRVYAEDYPGGDGQCFQGMVSGKYVRKHVPFLSFKNIQESPKRCANIVNARKLDDDVSSNNLPEYSMYIPNEDNSGHTTSVKFADHWLAKRFGSLLQNPAFMRDMLVIFTFDEDDFFGTNRVYTVLYGKGVNGGTQSAQLSTHLSLLRTIEDAFGLGTLGKYDALVPPITDIWQ